MLDTTAGLDILAGFTPGGAKRIAPQGGDSPLGNLLATAMWLRLGVQTDFSLTNTTGIRTDLNPGPVTIEEMFNIFPFNNAITKMELSGLEVQELFDFVARRSEGRGASRRRRSRGRACASTAAGARAPTRTARATSTPTASAAAPARASTDAATCPRAPSRIFIGHRPCAVDADCGPNAPAGTCSPNAYGGTCNCTADDACGTYGACQADADCVAPGLEAGLGISLGCDTSSHQCVVPGICNPGPPGTDVGACSDPMSLENLYSLATSDYLAGGGSGYLVLQRNTTQQNTNIQQRDAITDYFRQGHPCGYVAGADRPNGLAPCSTDADCAGEEGGFVCACPGKSHETSANGTTSCGTDPAGCAGQGLCVLQACRDQVAQYHDSSCAASPYLQGCLSDLNSCSLAGEECKFLSCVDSVGRQLHRQPRRDARPMRTRNALSTIATLAGAALLGVSVLGGGGCSGFATVPSSERIQVELETPASQLPTRASPRKISFTTPDDYVVKVSALKQDGSVDTSFNGYIRLSSKPGTVTAVSGAEVNGRNVLLTNGVADQVTVSVLAGFGDTRIWAEDEGYVPADPARTPPPECSNGLDDNDDGKIDYPNEPGCYAANDDTENGGTYAAGISPPLWYDLPRVADVRGVSQGGTGTSFPSEAVTIDTGYRGENDWTYAPPGCGDSTCAGVVVTYVSSAGFFVTDLNDDASGGRGFGSVYAYNFSAPPNMRQCDRLRSLGGTSSDFYGFTEINYPTWELEEWDPTARPCLIPEPHKIAPVCTINGATIPNCTSLGDPNGMLKVAAALVRVESANSVQVQVGANFGPDDACCGFDKEDPCCCGGSDPAAPQCAPGDAGRTPFRCAARRTRRPRLHALVHAGPEREQLRLEPRRQESLAPPAPPRTRLACSNACDGEYQCSEYLELPLAEPVQARRHHHEPRRHSFQANGTLDIQGDGSGRPEFNPVLLRREDDSLVHRRPLSTSRAAASSRSPARCADDIVLDMNPARPLGTACVHARTILDNSEGSN